MKSCFVSFRPGKHIIRVANNQVVVAEGKGNVVLQVLFTTGKSLTLTLNDVFYCPQFTVTNIFSTNFLARSRRITLFICLHKNTSQLVGTITILNCMRNTNFCGCQLQRHVRRLLFRVLTQCLVYGAFLLRVKYVFRTKLFLSVFLGQN